MAEQSLRLDGKAQLPALTGVRALAAFMVLTLHAGQNFPNWLINGAASNRGYLGVDLFFLLSGFIIAHVYVCDLVPLRAHAWRVFLWHRFVRLFPAHAAVLIVLVGLIVAVRSAGIELNDQRSWNYRDLPWHFLMVHAWGSVDVAGWNAPSWSISAEWFAYLLFPIIAAITLALPRRVALPLALVPLLATALVFHLRDWGIGSAWIGAPALLRVSSEFSCGVLLYRAIRIDTEGVAPRLSDISTFGALVAFGTATFFDADDFVLIAVLAILIAGVSGQGAVVRAVFGCRPVVWMGEISYSIYLVHFPVLLVLRHGVDRIARLHIAETEASRLLLFAISIAIVIGVASLSYYLVEHPARQRWRNAFGTIVPQQTQISVQAMPDRRMESIKVKQIPN
jgi:peptidoglycan/LPS O-acetylase OafA/YrhL